MTAGQHVTEEIFPYRTDRERAADYLHRGAARRPTAPPQTEGLFDEPEHTQRQWVPLPAPPEPEELFPDLEPMERKLVAVDGCPKRGDGGE